MTITRDPSSRGPVGRFAPSPSGVLHLGNLRTALASWLSVRAAGGRWVLRLEDVDRARCRRDLGEAQLRDLERLELDWDGPVVWQSDREEAYRGALAALKAQDRLYGCRCSRKDLATLASAPHASDGLRPYPGTCRNRGWVDGAALRCRLPEGHVAWEDRVLGPQVDDPAQLTGDPILHRRDGCYAYHLAVVVDDGAQGITEVVRGGDLREVTATHIRLQQALGMLSPAYAHLALVPGPGGQRLGKRAGALGLGELAGRGICPRTVLGWLGYSLGCLERPEPCRAEDLVPGFCWSTLPDREPDPERLADLGAWITRVSA